MVEQCYFPLKNKLSIASIADRFGLEKTGGDAALEILDVVRFEEAKKGAITFYDAQRLKNRVAKTQASACFVRRDQAEALADYEGALIWTERPYQHFAQLADLMFAGWDAPFDGSLLIDQNTLDPSVKIGLGSVIANNAEIGSNTCIGNHVSIGPGVKLGSNCRIHDHVSIQASQIGDDVVIWNGSAIGQAGFGFVMDQGAPVDMPQLGSVIIENNVSIGANTCVDRGALTKTIIGEGSRIDNLVQIGHGVKIGKGCVIVSQVGISGSVDVGNYVMMGGQVGVADNITIGDGVKIAAQSGVHRSIEANQVMGGTPVMPILQWRRQSAFLARLSTKRGNNV
ncbi:MAG: UDP-3-O-(3-hydroxymyristoyl)glucosamine N-acyltransferase [Rickettsiales bacterium]|nr:UDP-3-O-(3-hydroxymyristoyl)glucosamine N-acyltransferase [Rickettsiales bacterium]|tara:strand:- start:48228 stop:49247 length:1020 start_codon:yes stop_codon:yes gene_type:complete